MSYFSKVFSQSAWQILGKLISSLSTFIILGIVARNYGQAGTGVFTLALAYLAIFYLLADFGFNAHILKKIQISNFKFQIEEFKKLLGVRILWSCLLVILAVGLLPLWPFATQPFSQAVIIGSLAIIASGVFTTCNLIFQSKLRYDLSVLAASLGTILSLGVFLILSANKFPVPWLLFAHLMGWILIATFALVLIKRLLSSVLPIYDIRYTKYLFKDSWPIAATLALNVVYFRADSFMIAYFRNMSDVGIYNTAYSVFQSALVLPTFIMNSYYPLMLTSLSKVKLVAAGLLGLAVAGTVITTLLAPFIVNLLTGGGFTGSAVSLQVLSLGFPAFFLSSLLMWILISKDKYKIMFFIYTLGLFFNLILNFYYIPKYSFIAASWTTIVSEYFVLALQIMVLWLGQRKTK